MRLSVRFAATILALIWLAACQMQAPAGSAAVAGLTAEAITVTPLGAAPNAGPSSADVQLPGKPEASVVVLTPDKATPRPKPRPAATGGATAEAAKPALPAQSPDPAAQADTAAPVSPEQALCEKTGGQWTTPQTSGAVCIKRTRDAGKSCHTKRECQGECLARSNTCAPITPLMGCNDILQADGSEVTLCLQ